MREKQAAVMADLSGFGRCSLTVALPVLSAMGIHASCMPTALLSTHTGGFTGYSFRDLTQDMRAFAKHWQSIPLTFDALYSGYLGSFEQIEVVREVFSAFRTENQLVLVDPAMADDGKLYSLYTPEMARGTKKLCMGADVIVPNITEARYLLDESCGQEPLTENEARALCADLRKLGAKRVVLTGVTLEGRENEIGAACDDGSECAFCMAPRVPARYDGTGDLFASVLLGALLRGKKLRDACGLAADYVSHCVALSVKNQVNPHYGVDFECDLWKLGREMRVVRE